MGDFVTLTPEELRTAARDGIERRISSLVRDASQFYGFDPAQDSVWDADILGSIGEYVVSKHLKLPYKGAGKKDDVDVGLNIQVRTTKYKDGHLLLNRRDHDDHLFILVKWEKGFTYEIVGCIHGWEAKIVGQLGRLNKHREESLRVEQSKLRPVTDADRRAALGV